MMRINFIIIRSNSEPIFMMRNHEAEMPIEYSGIKPERELGILDKANTIAEKVDKELSGQ